MRGFKIHQKGPRRMEKEESWPVEYLLPYMENKLKVKTRLALVNVETARLKSDLIAFNVPNRSTEELAAGIE